MQWNSKLCKVRKDRKQLKYKKQHRRIGTLILLTQYVFAQSEEPTKPPKKVWTNDDLVKPSATSTGPESQPVDRTLAPKDANIRLHYVPGQAAEEIDRPSIPDALSSAVARCNRGDFFGRHIVRRSPRLEGLSKLFQAALEIQHDYCPPVGSSTVAQPLAHLAVKPNDSKR
jgi:hypothetical protein